MDQIYEVHERPLTHGGSWVVVSGDRVVGELLWRRADGGDMDIYRTWTEPQLRGKGLARKLLERAVDRAQDESVRIIPTCSYVGDTMARDPKMKPLMTPA